MSFKIIKQTGEQEEFDLDKLRRSLTWPGASPAVIEKIVHYVEKNKSHFQTTEDLYRYAFEELKEAEPQVAAKYHLKRSLLEFGPSGYPFEQYVAEIFRAQGYECKTNLIINGWCVDHEIDVMAKKDDKIFMVECKFHNELGYKTHVQVPLYMNSRFQDITKKEKESNALQFTHIWIVSNTEFTHEALKYSNCMKIRLTSWNFPQEESLAHLIVKFGLYPVTSLVSLSKAQRYFFINNGLVLAKDVSKNIDLLKQAGMKDYEIKNFIQQCDLMCGL